MKSFQDLKWWHFVGGYMTYFTLYKVEWSELCGLTTPKTVELNFPHWTADQVVEDISKSDMTFQEKIKCKSHIRSSGGEDN